MSSSLKDYRPMPKYETLYEINIVGKIKALDRVIMYKNIIRTLPQQCPETFTKGKTIYAIIRDENFKNRKVNITKMINNIFGRQTPIIIKVKPKEKIVFMKPINRNGASGYAVEQFEDGKIIGVFKSFAAAAKAVGGEYRHISDACYGKRKFYAGYQWKFKNNNKK